MNLIPVYDRMHNIQFIRFLILSQLHQTSKWMLTRFIYSSYHGLENHLISLLLAVDNSIDCYRTLKTESQESVMVANLPP